MKPTVLLCMVLATACSAGHVQQRARAQAATPTSVLPATSSTCRPLHPSLSPGSTGGGIQLPFTIRLDRGYYHRIPTSVRAPAKVKVTVSASPAVHFDDIKVVVVRKGVDITNGPFAYGKVLAKDVAATELTFPISLPPIDAAGHPLPRGQYLWGITTHYREIYSDTCGGIPAASPHGGFTGSEMPFLVVA